MRLGERPVVQTAVIPTGSIALDVALGVGGLPRGRVVEIYGPESSGKTTVALHAVANAQRAGGIAAFIDAEHALDPEYARAL
ncbi:RecA protein, partial [Micromonospora sp. M42]